MPSAVPWPDVARELVHVSHLRLKGTELKKRNEDVYHVLQCVKTLNFL
jgi:hypothetical protein